MDFTTIINELGGGVNAVALFAMSAVILHLWRRLNTERDQARTEVGKLTDRLLDQAQKHSAELVQTIRTIEHYDRARGGGQ